jgi:hypothetical protein
MLFTQGHPLREVDRVRRASRMATLFAPALRSASRSEAMSATVVGIARRRVAGEAGTKLTFADVGKDGSATCPPVEADLEFEVVRRSTLF